MYDWDHYEELALDYIEGNLSDERRRTFESFMESHPEVAQEVRSLKECMPILSVDRVEFPDKERLKRGVKRRLRWRQVGSFVGGAAAASVVVGLFGLLGSLGRIDDSIEYGGQQLAEQIEVIYQETAKSVAAETEVAQADDVKQDVVSDVISVPEKVVSTVDTYVGAVTPLTTLNKRIEAPKVDKNQEEELNPVVLEPLFTDSYAVPDLIASSRDITLEQVELPEATTDELPGYDDSDEGLTDGTKEAMRILASLLAPLDDLLPIKRYSTENERGIEIASFIRIGNRVE